jgi:hypothetical protein
MTASDSCSRPGPLAGCAPGRARGTSLTELLRDLLVPLGALGVGRVFEGELIALGDCGPGTVQEYAQSAGRCSVATATRSRSRSTSRSTSWPPAMAATSRRDGYWNDDGAR